MSQVGDVAQNEAPSIDYSICVANFNMADTLQEALTSVLNQLDERFEVVVVDDGSSDDSIKVLGQLAKQYPSLRYISLARTRKRLLGETRNVGIRAARGEYILLHIDADDVWEPYIKDFVAVFHRIEKCLGRDIYLQGQQIGIGRKSFLLERGPYRNTFVEDRDMWHRLASEKAYLLLEHRVFRKRLPVRVGRKIYKAIWIKTYNHMLYDLRRNFSPRKYVINALTGPFRRNLGSRSVIHEFVRMVLVLPTYVISRFKEPLEMPPSMPSHSEYVEYREKTKGTYSQLMTRYGCDGDLSFLRESARSVFEAGSK